MRPSSKGDGLAIVNTDATTGQIEFALDRLFAAIGGAVAPGSALGSLALNRVGNGTFDVTLVVGGLRMARGASPQLVNPYSVALVGIDRIVAGYGFQGKVTVTP